MIETHLIAEEVKKKSNSGFENITVWNYDNNSQCTVFFDNQSSGTILIEYASRFASNIFYFCVDKTNKDLDEILGQIDLTISSYKDFLDFVNYIQQRMPILQSFIFDVETSLSAPFDSSGTNPRISFHRDVKILSKDVEHPQKFLGGIIKSWLIPFVPFSFEQGNHLSMNIHSIDKLCYEMLPYGGIDQDVEFKSLFEE